MRYGLVIAAVALVAIGAVALTLLIQQSGWLSSDGLQLTVAKPTGGTITARGINCGTDGSECSARLPKGDIIEFEVHPDSGFTFAGYTGDCAQNGRLVMNGAQTCGATFAANAVVPPVREQLITVARPTGGTLFGAGIKCGTQGNECSTKRPEGSLVKLEAQADKGFTLRNYTGDCAQGGETIMSAPRTCGALFSGPGPGVVAKKPDPIDPRPPIPTPDGTNRTSTSKPRGGTGDVDVPVAPLPDHKPDPPDVLPGPPPPPPPPDPRVLAKKQIDEVLERFRSAYEELNYPGIVQAFPNAPTAIREQFKQIKSLQYTFAGPPQQVELDPAAGTAVVDIAVSQNTQMKVGSNRPAVNLKYRVNLHKVDAERWVISAIAPK
jgi:hypothetical protein